MMRFILTALISLTLLSAMRHHPAQACSICESVAPTICEEIGKADISVFARFAGTPNGQLDDPDSFKALFRIEQVLRGRKALGETRQARVLFFPGPRVKPGTMFLILGNKVPTIRWTTPIVMDDRNIAYIKKMLSLPEQGVDRLLFAMDYLEDAQAMLRRDAYDEFGRADYSILQQLRPQLEAKQLIAKIESDKTEPSMRRLHYTLLSVCARSEELAWLERMLRAHRPDRKASLSALIACYLTVAGADGLALVEQEFLTSEAPDDRMAAGAAVTALRFHGQESNVIDRQAILEVFRHLLERPQLAGRILSDLARWEDWSVMNQVADLFRSASDDTGWIRQPVVQYLAACPLPEAKIQLAELKKIDPVVVRQAQRFLFPGPSPKSSTGPASQAEVRPGATPTAPEAAVNRSTGKTVSPTPDADTNRLHSGETSTDRGRIGWIVLSVAVGIAFMVLLLFRGVFAKRDT